MIHGCRVILECCSCWYPVYEVYAIDPFLGVKWSELESNHSPLFSAKVMNVLSLAGLCHHGFMFNPRDFTYTFVTLLHMCIKQLDDFMNNELERMWKEVVIA
jgi:hypothetical protein